MTEPKAVPDAPARGARVAFLAGPLCTLERTARQLSQTSELLERILPLATGDVACDDVSRKRNAISAVCDLLEKSGPESSSRTLSQITSSEHFMSEIVDVRIAWRYFRMVGKLAAFEVGRTALVKRGVAKKLRDCIVKDLRSLNAESSVDPERVKRLVYAMQARVVPTACLGALLFSDFGFHSLVSNPACEITAGVLFSESSDKVRQQCVNNSKNIN